jgi:hypothetical protein
LDQLATRFDLKTTAVDDALSQARAALKVG